MLNVQLMQFGLTLSCHFKLFQFKRFNLGVILKLFLSLEDKLQAKEPNVPTLLRISVTLTYQLVIYSEQKLPR